MQNLSKPFKKSNFHFILGDFDRVIDEYERAKSLYGETDNEIFLRYLEEVEAGVDVLRVELSKKLREDKSSLDQRKRIITNLVQLNSEQDPAWECIQISYDRLLKMLDQNRDEHLALDRKKAMTTNLAKPMFMNKSESIFPGIVLSSKIFIW